MQQTLEDDWEMSVNSQEILNRGMSVNSQKILNKTETFKNDSSHTNKPVQHICCRNMNLDDISTNAIPILKNPRISTDKYVKLSDEFNRMIIRREQNKLWHITDLTKYLKSAIAYYEKDIKATTTKTNQKQIDTLVKAIDKLNGIISATRQQSRNNPNNEDFKTKLSETIKTKKNLENEQQTIMLISVESKKSDAKTLKELSQTLLRFLSKNDKKSYDLHILLTQKLNPSGYAARIAEINAKKTLEEEQRKRTYDNKREQYRIDKIIENYSQNDKQNYMKARELYMQKKYIPREFQKYIMVIEYSPYLSFERDLSKVVKKTIGSDYQFKQEFPTLGNVIQHNAWTQKLGTRIEDKPIVQGSWKTPIDTNRLQNLPDVPKVVTTKIVCTNITCEDEYQNSECVYQYRHNTYFNDEYSDDEYSDDEW